MNAWKLTFDNFVPEKERLRESLCTLGNGYFGTRGADCEMPASAVHYPGTYVAGLYNELTTEVAGRHIVNEDFVNCPNWTMLTYKIGDVPWLDRFSGKILSWRKELNMHRGLLLRRMRWQDVHGRTTLIEEERIVSMAHPHFAALRYTIIPENYAEKITVRSGLDGLIINAGVERYRQLNSKHLEPYTLGAMKEDGVYLQMQTNHSKVQITEAQRTFVYHKGERIYPKINILLHGRDRIIQEFVIDAKQGEKYTMEKVVCLYTSHDKDAVDNCQAAQTAVARTDSFDQLFEPHQARWRELWKKCDITVEGDSFVELTLRLHTFHLLQTASTSNAQIDAGFPARGLHGEAYRGHVFWDELFAFPFYNLREPEITRSLLMYRYKRLKAAKECAKAHGFKGAMFPWQSASRGDETTQIIHLNPLSGEWDIDYSSLQRHVSIAVAYNFWSYYEMSGDKEFLIQYGAEAILEIALFFASLSTFNKKTKRFEIKGVMGPDEFHEKYPEAKEGGINNNAYTNVLAVWVITKALEILEKIIPEEKGALLLKLNLKEEDLTRFRHILKAMTVPVERDGFIQQFEGFKDLKELDWESYRTKYENIHRIDRILKAEELTPNDYKTVKQADALMIFYLLGEAEVKKIFQQLGYGFHKNHIKKNYDYYIRRTSHGSTLSRVTHCFVAQKVGYHDQALKFFIEALKSDIADIQGGTTAEGIHCGVMGGTITVFLRCFAGVSFRSNALVLEPDFPFEWKRIRFHICYRDVLFQIEESDKGISVTAEPLTKTSGSSGDISLIVKGKPYALSAGKTLFIKP